MAQAAQGRRVDVDALVHQMRGDTTAAAGAIVVVNTVNYVRDTLHGSQTDVAWMLAAAALVLLMTPGLAYFYGGMIDTKNIISTMLQSFIAMGVISVLWIVVGFSLAFGESQGGLIGDPTSFFMFQNVLDGAPWSMAPTIPLVLFALFQLKFAIITPALITGTFAERIKFRSYIIFLILFSLFIYAPLAHWTWHPDGFLFKLGVLDFAGKLSRVEDIVSILIGKDFRSHRIPRHHGGHIRCAICSDHVRIRRIHHCHVLFAHSYRFESASERVVRDGELHQIDLLALDVLKLVLALEDDRVVAVRVVADNHSVWLDRIQDSGEMSDGILQIELMVGAEARNDNDAGCRINILCLCSK